MINRSCLAGNSRLLTGWRNNDQAIRPTRYRDIGLIYTVITPAVYNSWTGEPPYRSALTESLDTSPAGKLQEARRVKIGCF